MGVHGLWTLLEPVGKPVPLETLENKVLAVDVSIWLHQATKGFRDAQGNSLHNAHLLGLCHRLCKLLFYKIKPVFVFDGGVPLLKRQTMISRQKIRSDTLKNKDKVAEKILSNYIQSELINKELGNKPGKSKSLPVKKKQEKDIFELPPIPIEATSVIPESSSSGDEDFEDADTVTSQLGGHNIHSLDFSSDAFRSLPTQVQHEILLELKDTRKQNSWSRIHEMPQKAFDFSGFQMQRLLKRRNLQQRLDEVVEEIGRKNHEHLNLADGELAESRSLASDNSTRYVLIKKVLAKSNHPKIVENKSVLPDPVQQLTSQPIITDTSGTDLELLDNEFTQEELLFISGTDNSKSVEQKKSSSSEDDSDFEEVLPLENTQRIMFSIPIKKSPTYNEEEDIFADVFHPVGEPSNIAPPSVQLPKPSIPIPELDISESKYELTISESEDELTMSQEDDIFQVSNFTVLDDKLPLLNPDSPVTSEHETPFDDNVNNEEYCEESDEQMAREPIEHVADNQMLSCVSEAEKVAFEIPDRQVSASDFNDSTTQGCVQMSNEIKLIKEKQPTAAKSQEKSPVINEKRREELNELNNCINAEQSMLIQQHGKQERLATSITDQMYLEAQEMLRLFGIPYLVAPMEAEAQCAFLNEVGLTHGTITDDSDIWLFGGRQVYKNFFNQGKYVEFFEVGDIEKVFKLGREKLIHLALLTGSDYTEGVEGVGPVTALEILAEFSSDGIEGLEQFREWLLKIQTKKNALPGNKIRHKLRNLKLKPGFPSHRVVEAYIHPEVNESRRQFSWMDADMEALRDYLSEKIGWNGDKFKSVVVPVLEKFKNKESQTRIDSFFSVKLSSKTSVNVSKRVMNAIHKADFGVDLESNESQPNSTAESDSGKKRRKPITSSKSSAKTPRKTIDQTEPSTSANAEAPEIIWQKEKDRQQLGLNKLKAIEILKKSRGRGKCPVKRFIQPKVQLSESDSN